jgi:hypothetical protein
MNLRMKRIILALGTAAGLLAVGAPVAAQASTNISTAPKAAWSATKATRAAAAQGLVVGQLNPYTAVTYYLNAPYAGCTFSVGDRYEGSNGAAVGMAVADCPSYHTFRILVYLDYETTSGGQYTWQNNVSGTPYYTYDLGVSTGCGRNLDANYTTYARISIDGSPYSGLFQSGYEEPYNAGSSCP